MLGRLGDAAKDAVETLRRLFHDPPVGAVGLALRARGRDPLPLLAASVREGLAPFTPALGGQRTVPEAAVVAAPMNLATQARGEAAWADWCAGARVVAMPRFAEGPSARLEVPPLPRRPRVQAAAAPGFRTRSRPLLEALARPAGRGIAPALAAPACRRGLDLALALPVAVAGEDLAAAPRPVQMRCSLQMVKATGENVRNLDLLGRYRVPGRGVRELRHDAASGRVLLTLGPEASGAAPATLLIARRRDDRALVTCIVEEP